MNITQCSHCKQDTGGNHEPDCPMAVNRTTMTNTNYLQVCTCAHEHGVTIKVNPTCSIHGTPVESKTYVSPDLYTIEQVKAWLVNLGYSTTADMIDSEYGLKVFAERKGK